MSARSRQQIGSGSRCSSICLPQKASLTSVGFVGLFGHFGSGRGRWRVFWHEHTNAPPQRNILADLLAVKMKLNRNSNSLLPWKGLLDSSGYSLPCGQAC